MQENFDYSGLFEDWGGIEWNWGSSGSGGEYAGGGYLPSNPLDNLGGIDYGWGDMGIGEPDFSVTGVATMPGSAGNLDGDYWDSVPFIAYGGPNIGDWSFLDPPMEVPPPPGGDGGTTGGSSEEATTPGECDGFWGKLKCALRNINMGSAPPMSTPRPGQGIPAAPQGPNWLLLAIVALAVYAVTRK